MHRCQRRGARALPAIALLLLLAVTPARALVVVQRDFPELVARAEQIVVGTVTEVSERPDASGTPFTYVTFDNLSVLKGDVGATLTLRIYGGGSGAVAVQVPDMPTFTVGERAVLFVAGNGRDLCPLIGIWQGRFRVRYDATRGADVIEDSNRQPVVGRAGRQLMRAAQSPSSAALTVNDFRQLIVDELAHPTDSTP